MRYKRRNWKQVGVLFVIVLDLVFLGLLFSGYDTIKKIEIEKNNLKNQLASYERTVYVATEKIPKGTVLTTEKLWQEIRYYECSQKEFITEEMIGMTAAEDIAEGTCLTVSMVIQVENDVREVFVDKVDLPEHVKTGDRVDVRIRYDNAEEYVVLADKALVKCESGKGMVLNLREEEILMLSSAIADSELYGNTRLYVVEYPEYKSVNTGKITYVANREVLALLGRENTEGKSRDAIEQRLVQKK